MSLVDMTKEDIAALVMNHYKPYTSLKEEQRREKITELERGYERYIAWLEIQKEEAAYSDDIGQEGRYVSEHFLPPEQYIFLPEERRKEEERQVEFHDLLRAMFHTIVDSLVKEYRVKYPKRVIEPGFVEKCVELILRALDEVVKRKEKATGILYGSKKERTNWEEFMLSDPYFETLTDRNRKLMRTIASKAVFVASQDETAVKKFQKILYGE